MAVVVCSHGNPMGPSKLLSTAQLLWRPVLVVNMSDFWLDSLVCSSSNHKASSSSQGKHFTCTQLAGESRGRPEEKGRVVGRGRRGHTTAEENSSNLSTGFSLLLFPFSPHLALFKRCGTWKSTAGKFAFPKTGWGLTGPSLNSATANLMWLEILESWCFSAFVGLLCCSSVQLSVPYLVS